MTRPALLAITCGELAGVGPELILKAWCAKDQEALPPFVVLGPVDEFKSLSKDLGLKVDVQAITSLDDVAAIFPTALPVLDIPATGAIERGHINPKNGDVVVKAIVEATQMALRGDVAGIVTAPLHKAALYDAGFAFPGHTEFLAKLCEDHDGDEHIPVMMLSCPELRVVPVTIHVPLSAVPTELTTDKIIAIGRKTAHALRNDLGIAAPRLAVAALNPHAGEDRQMGHEEISVIQPAIGQLRAEGIDATGPYPADTLFHEEARAHYDVVLCMYHDQALIPLKTIDFYGGVNVTLGLPIVRTSPDHGTALGIAGQGIANARSLIEAINVAGEITRERQQAVKDVQV